MEKFFSLCLKFLWSLNARRETFEKIAEPNVYPLHTFLHINPLSTNPTKWWNTLKQFFGNSRQVIWVRLTFLWGWHLKCWTGVVSPNTIAIKRGLYEVKMAKVFLKLVSLERISAKKGDEAKEQFSEVNLRSCNSSRRKVIEFLHVYTEIGHFLWWIVYSAF